MHLVCNVVKDLQPIAGEDISEGHKLRFTIRLKRVPQFERRPLVRRAHICKDEPIALQRWISSLTDGFAKSGSFVWLRGRFEQRTINSVVETVIAATNSVVLNYTIFEGSSTMRTVAMHYTNLTREISKCDQVFTKNPDGMRNILKLIR